MVKKIQVNRSLGKPVVKKGTNSTSGANHSVSCVLPDYLRINS